jgi:3-methyladenine DNA glycosylase AlkD
MLADALEARLRADADPVRAEKEKRYLKSDLDFIGVRMPRIRSALKDLARPMGHDELVAEVVGLWAAPIFERRAAAVILLSSLVDRLSAADLGMLEWLVRESRTWALVDGLAVDVLGGLVVRDPESMAGPMDRWADDADFWVRRASLLCELRPIRAGQPMDRFLGRADRMLDEREFFIRKAIGWVLREAGKRRPSEVVAWLEPRAHGASGVTMREAVKHLPAMDAARLRTAGRERGAAG